MIAETLHQEPHGRLLGGGVPARGLGEPSERDGEPSRVQGTWEKDRLSERGSRSTTSRSVTRAAVAARPRTPPPTIDGVAEAATAARARRESRVAEKPNRAFAAATRARRTSRRPRWPAPWPRRRGSRSASSLRNALEAVEEAKEAATVRRGVRDGSFDEGDAVDARVASDRRRQADLCARPVERPRRTAESRSMPSKRTTSYGI